MQVPPAPDPEVERIVRESIARFEAYLGWVVPMAKSNGWMVEFEAEIRRVIVEARK